MIRPRISRILSSINNKSHLYHLKRKIKPENVNIHVIASILIPILLRLVVSFTSYKAYFDLKTCDFRVF